MRYSCWLKASEPRLLIPTHHFVFTSASDHELVENAAHLPPEVGMPIGVKVGPLVGAPVGAVVLVGVTVGALVAVLVGAGGGTGEEVPVARGLGAGPPVGVALDGC